MKKNNHIEKNVIIIGAGGHGKVIADIILQSGDTVKGFLDDNNSGNLLGMPILGCIDDYKNFLEYDFIIAIGNADLREKIAKQLNESHAHMYTAIHPQAAISNWVDIGEGCVIMANAIINANSSIGRHCIINSGAVVEHDNIIGDFVHISVGARLAGNVYIGEKTWIGIGATISNNIRVYRNCVIGAGSVVVNNIVEDGTYIGVPAKKHK